MIRVCFLHAKNEKCRPVGWGSVKKPEPGFVGGVPQKGGCYGYQARLTHSQKHIFEFSRSDWNDLNTAICSDPYKIVGDEDGLPILRASKWADDEIILLITACGEEGDTFGDVEAVDGEIIRKWRGYMYSCPVTHLVARLSSEDGHVALNIRRADNRRAVAVFSWRCRHFVLSLADYNKAIENNSLLSGRETITQELEELRERCFKREQSKKYKQSLAGTDRLRLLATRLKSCDKERLYDFKNPVYIFMRYKNGKPGMVAYLYSERNVQSLEERVLQLTDNE